MGSQRHLVGSQLGLVGSRRGFGRFTVGFGGFTVGLGGFTAGHVGFMTKGCEFTGFSWFQQDQVWVGVPSSAGDHSQHIQFGTAPPFWSQRDRSPSPVSGASAWDGMEDDRVAWGR